MQMILPFFLMNKKSATEVIKAFNIFFFLDLKSILQTLKLLPLVLRSGVKMGLCGMECIELRDDIKTLNIYFSYNKKLEQGKNLLNHIAKIRSILKICKLRHLTIERRMAVFKSLAISISIHLLLVNELNININI